jgi:hypothetical protein
MYESSVNVLMVMLKRLLDPVEGEREMTQPYRRSTPPGKLTMRVTSR